MLGLNFSRSSWLYPVTYVFVICHRKYILIYSILILFPHFEMRVCNVAKYLTCFQVKAIKGTLELSSELCQSGIRVEKSSKCSKCHQVGKCCVNCVANETWMDLMDCYVFLETKGVKASEQFIGFSIQVQIFEENSHWACVKVAKRSRVCVCMSPKCLIIWWATTRKIFTYMKQFGFAGYSCVCSL